MISVTVLTKNSEKYLPKVLESLKKFDEVLVYDTGSTDNTISIACSYPNVTLKEGEFIGFGPTHNAASTLARNSWILSVDSDEVVTPELLNEILNLSLDKNVVYSIPRNNYFRGKWIRWCGWYPDHVYRLYNRDKTRFTDAQVHESVIVDGIETQRLKAALIHYSYADTADFLVKMQSYSHLFAQQNKGRKSSSTGKAVCHGLFTFFKSYILKKGFLGGSEGFEISVYNANTAFYKYLKLAEVNKNSGEST
jgi:glycosyltransferase involved in cell wall biosynthesis